MRRCHPKKTQHVRPAEDQLENDHLPKFVTFALPLSLSAVDQIHKSGCTLGLMAHFVCTHCTYAGGHSDDAWIPIFPCEHDEGRISAFEGGGQRLSALASMHFLTSALEVSPIGRTRT
jgi:hypothetical protein